MTGTALTVAQALGEEAQEAKAAGNLPLANKRYAAQLDALRRETPSTPGNAVARATETLPPRMPTPAAYDRATVQRALAKIADVHGTDARLRLEREHGAELPAMFAVHDAVAKTYPTAYSVAEREGLALDPSFILVVAAFGREAANRPGDWNRGFAPPRTSISSAGSASTMDAKEYREALKANRAAQAAARGERDERERNRLYLEEQELIRANEGSGRIVDGVRVS